VKSSSGERLQKLLAAAGLGSRRECEELIVQGRVEVDRKVVNELGAKADPQTQEIRLDGQVLRLEPKVYYLVNKPPGVVSTNSDPSGRARVVDLAPDKQRLFTVGRLDRSSAGLILLTNDGELANRIAHPRYGIEKVYHVEVVGRPAREDLKKLRDGIHLAEAFVRVEHLRVKRRLKNSTLLEIILSEGRNREIRRMLARLGHKVIKLTRVAIGPLRLGDMPPGAFRELEGREIRQLKSLLRGGSTQSRESNNRQRKTRAAQTRATHGRASQGRSAQTRSSQGGPSQGRVQQGKPQEKTSRLPKTGVRQATVLAYDDEPATPRPGKKKRVRRERQKHRDRAAGNDDLSVESGEAKTAKRAVKGKRSSTKKRTDDGKRTVGEGAGRTKKKASYDGAKSAGRGKSASRKKSGGKKTGGKTAGRVKKSSGGRGGKRR